MSSTPTSEPISILASGLPNPAKKERQIFVAYSYRLYPKSDYRKVYGELARAFQVEFVFADEKITTLHVLQKIANYIRESRFGIYDISGWNANVTLELGLAYGLSERAFIALDPAKTDVSEVPADLRGIDRIQYSSYTELGAGIEKVLSQEFPLPRTSNAENEVKALRDQALALVRDSSKGLKVTDLAKALGVSVDLAKVVVKPLVGPQLKIDGIKRGARYLLVSGGAA